MKGKLIIYGATGYTGQLVSEQAKQLAAISSWLRKAETGTFSFSGCL